MDKKYLGACSILFLLLASFLSLNSTIIPAWASPDAETLRPNADGYSVQWSISDSTHSGATSDQSDTSYIYSSTELQNEFLNVDDPTFPESATINSIQVYYRLRSVGGSAAPEKVDLYIRSDGTDTETDPNVGVDRNGFVDVAGTAQTTNPATGSAWIKSEVAALQAGIIVDTVRAGEEIRCAEIWVVVGYTVTNTASNVDQLRLSETADEINTTTVDVNSWYDWEVNVTDDDQLLDIVNVTVRIMENPSVEINADTPNFNESGEYWFRYLNMSDAWEWHDGSQWNNTDLIYLNQSYCSYPTKTNTNGWYLFMVRLSKIAAKSNSWEFAALAYDSADNTAKKKMTGLTVNLYLEITVNTNTHQWSSVLPGDSDILIDEENITVTVTANANFDLRTKGDGDLQGPDTIPLSNVKVHKDTSTSATSLSTTYQDIGGLTNQSPGEDLSKTFKVWLTVPTGKRPGDYTYVLSIQIVEYV